MRFYRLLLRLYPSSFRQDYGEEISDVFAERSHRMSGPLAWLRIALAGMADIVPNAIATHRELLVQDLRYAVRSLLRAPGFTATAILVAMLGVGANTAAFSLADFVLMRPLPFAQPERLIKMSEKIPTGYNEVSPSNYRDWKAQSRSFQSMAAYTSGAWNLVGMGEPRRLEGVQATPELLPLLGVQPLLGHFYTVSEAENGAPMMISHALWQAQFGGARDIVGKVVRLNGVPYTITGVMPASFQFPYRGAEAWTPLVLREDDMQDRTDTYLNVIGRLRDGVSFQQATQELNLIGSRLEKQYPENDKIGIFARHLRDDVTQNARLLVLALCGASLCILLLSCANLANLFLARGAHRARELAVRAALGAGRERLVRQLITESFVVAITGGIAGVIVAALGVPLLARLVPSSLPMAGQPSVDLRVLGIAAIFIIVTGLAFGVLPAVRSGNMNALDALRADNRSGGGRTQRLRSALVILEIVASVVLLVSSGLLIRAVWNIQATNPGFEPERVLTMTTALPMQKYDTALKREQFYLPVLENTRALPGVKSAAFVTGLPLVMRGGIFTAVPPGERDEHDGAYDVSMRMVTPQYFATLRIPLRRGRDVSDRDTLTQPLVVVVSESLVKREWPGEDPIGKVVKIAGEDRAIVGVVGDVRTRGLERQSEPQVYLPYRQQKDQDFINYAPKVLVVRTSGAPESLLAAIRRVVQHVDPEQPISNVNTLESIVEEETAPRMTQLRILGALALIALLIAGIGIHGLLTYTVSKRLPELGVRRALGAQVSGIIRLVLREGVVLAAIGIAIGVFFAYLAARGMSSLLAGVRPNDPLTFFIAALLCFATVLAGCLRPAFRAAHVDPMIALRSD
jgi:putative ABC transport system permease protein